jgi:hypothetical protein
MMLGVTQLHRVSLSPKSQKFNSGGRTLELVQMCIQAEQPKEVMFMDLGRNLLLCRFRSTVRPEVSVQR